MTDTPLVALSFNEIEALGTKAARGAGLGWGHAEDLGRAVRWLARHAVGWAEPLLRLLDDADAASKVTALVLVVDRAGCADVGDGVTVDGDEVGWIVPMLAAAMYGRDVCATVRWAEGTMILEPDGSAHLDGAAFDVATGPAFVAIMAKGRAPALPTRVPLPRPAALRSADLARLSAYAARTAVPSSAASRARGAGSGRSDND